MLERTTQPEAKRFPQQDGFERWVGMGDWKMAVENEPFRLRGFKLLDGRTIRLYCRLLRQRHTAIATYRLYEDRRQGQWLEIVVGHFRDMEECPAEAFEQRIATDLLGLGLNKYSG